MSQRDSGYERKERDLYETPEWVTQAIVMRPPKIVWEPACGSGKMVSALGFMDAEIYGTDIADGQDFFAHNVSYMRADAIITNPPYVLATKFIEHALKLTEPLNGQVLMLLRTDFDHASTRKRLFGNCSIFSQKLVLTRRIKWFEDSTGSPSFNHAWFTWDWQHCGPPTLAYGP